MQCLKLIKIHELGSIKWVNVHYSSPLHPGPAEGYLFFGMYMIIYEKKEIFLILKCAYMIVKYMCIYIIMQT